MDAKVSLTFISDSEAEADEEVIWNPERGFLFVPDAPTFITSDKTSQQASLDIDEQGHKNEVSTQKIGSETVRRSFRKRTAIQKMPYSLERLKHRQLLEGIDLSEESAQHASRHKISKRQSHSFQLLANKELHHDSRLEKDEPYILPDAGIDEYQSHEGSQNRRKTENVVNTKSGATLPLDTDNLSQAHKSTKAAEADSDIYFRGRHVNLESGFRGILPKVAWIKAMTQRSAPTPTAAKPQKRMGKGVARRKIARPRPSTEDILLHDLFVTDDDDSAIEKNLVNPNTEKEQLYLSATLASEYYNSKYHEAYNFDELSANEDNEDYVSDNDFVILHDSNTQERSQHETGSVPLVSNALSGNENDSLVLGENEEAAEEDEGNTIDSMLTKAAKRSSGTIDGWLPRTKRIRSGESSLPRPKAKTSEKDIQRNGKHIYSPRSGIKVTKKAVRGNPRHGKTQPQIIQGRSANSASRASLDLYGLSEKKQPSSEKKAFYSLFTSSMPLYKFDRPPLETAVQKEGNRFTIVKKPEKAAGSLEAVSTSILSDDEQCTVSKSFDEVISGSVANPPVTVQITLSSRQFTISKYNPSMRDEIEAVFNHVVEVGASDIEVIRMNESLVFIIYQLNLTGIWEAIDTFHQRFRSKVNSLRDRAKPIHFYQIAACQVMLYEIMQFTNSSQLICQEITRKIMDHTVSFFKLLSRCLGSLAFDSDLLKESYHFLSKIVGNLKQSQLLWERLSKCSFPPRIALVVLKYFSIKEANWQIAEVENSYSSMVEWLAFIEFAIQVCEWKVNTDLLMSFYDILKSRKFQDFDEELTNEEPKICEPDAFSLPRKTIFNIFLQFVRSMPLPLNLVDRITPLGQIVSLNSPFLLANRINLLLVLAVQATASFEIKLEDLCYPYLRDSNERMSPKILDLILSGYLSLLKINASKKFHSRGRIISLVWQRLSKFREPALNKVWDDFMSDLYANLDELNNSIVGILKSLYPTLMSLLNKKDGRDARLLIKVFQENLHALEPAWVSRYLHQIVANLASNDEHTFWFYVSITEFLASKKLITWWSILNYNTFSHSQTHRVLLCTRAIERCDHSSYLQIRHMLFETAIDLLLKRSDVIFIKFLKALSRKDGKFKLIPSLNFTSTQFEIITGTLMGIKRMRDCTLIQVFMAKLKEELMEHREKKPLIADISSFLNVEFVDSAKSNADFLFLKSQFNISDEETEKSIFREALALQNNDYERALYIERELLRQGLNDSDLGPFLAKLTSSWSTGLYTNDFRFFSDLLEANAVANEGANYTDTQWFVLSNLMTMINTIMGNNFCQVTTDDFSGLFHLHSWICKVFGGYGFDVDIVSDESRFFKEICLLQTRILSISSGFSENSSLALLTEKFVSKVRLPHFSRNALTHPIQEMQKNYGPHLRSKTWHDYELSVFKDEVNSIFVKLSALVASNDQSTHLQHSTS